MPDLWSKTDEQIWRMAEKKSGKKAKRKHIDRTTGLWVDVEMTDGSNVRVYD